MPASSPSEVTLLGGLRVVAMGVATVELVYLTGWIGMALSLVSSPAIFIRGVAEPINSLSVLGMGSLLAAAFGAVGGLTVAVSFNLIGRRLKYRANQSLARSLVLRNQTR